MTPAELKPDIAGGDVPVAPPGEARVWYSIGCASECACASLVHGADCQRRARRHVLAAGEEFPIESCMWARIVPAQWQTACPHLVTVQGPERYRPFRAFLRLRCPF